MLTMDDSLSTYRGFKKLALAGLLAIIACILWELGWPLDNDEYKIIIIGLNLATIVHLIGVIGSYLTNKELRPPIRLLIFQVIGCLIILFLLTSEDSFDVEKLKQSELIRLIATIGLVIIPALVSLTHVFEWLIKRQGKAKPIMPPSMQFVASLVFIILSGAGLLLMPNSTFAGISFMDALFTSTSAVCVTGLSTINFSETFTTTGQVFVICLIQIGGLGVMTFAYFIAMIAGQGFSLKDHVLLKNLLDESNLNAAVKFVRSIVVLTLSIELMGAVFLYFSWQQFGDVINGKPLWWHAIFHAISAFCNAGFSTFHNGLMEQGIITCKSAQATIMALIAMGGLGFSIYYEIGTHVSKASQKKKPLSRIPWTPYFKLVLITTFILIVGGALTMGFIHHMNGGKDLGTSMWIGLFDSVSSRTAGVSITNMGDYLPSTAMVLCALMVIGGSPGGTAGGVRTTTIAIAAGEIMRILQGKQRVQFFRRSIERDVVDRCLVVLVMTGGWLGTMTLLCTYLRPDLSPLALFFENCSAFATVGLSLNLTPLLETPEKWIIITDMILGRAGIFLFFSALVGTPKPQHYHYPSVRIPLT